MKRLAPFRKRRERAAARPGIVVSVASAGDLLQWRPHGHLLVTGGPFSDDRAFRPPTSGLLHVREAIPSDDKKAIEDVACYMVRNPLSLKKLVYLDGQKAVLYRSRMKPSLGRNFEAMDPLEWLARLADHILDPGKHRTHFYGHYATAYAASGPPRSWDARSTGRSSPRSAAAPQAGRGSSPRSFRRIRSSANAAVARSRSLPTSPTP
jgi:Putative transposase